MFFCLVMNELDQHLQFMGLIPACATDLLDKLFNPTVPHYSSVRH